MKIDPVSKSSVVVKETDEVIEDLVKDNNILSEDDKEIPDEKQGSPEDEDSDSSAPKYIYYISDGKLMRVNKNDQTDRTAMSRAGGRNYIYDPKSNVIYYIRFNNVVKETLGEEDSAENLVSGIIAAGNMIYDDDNKKIYVTDINRGKIIEYDLIKKTRVDSVIGLRSPENLMPINNFDSILWTEKIGPDTIVYMGKPGSNNKVKVAESPLIDGSEDKYVLIPASNVLYTLRNGDLIRHDLQRQTSERVAEDVETVDMKGSDVVFATETGRVNKINNITGRIIFVTQVDDEIDSIPVELATEEVDPDIGVKEDKDMEDKDMEDKDMEDKDMEDKDMEDKDREDKDREDKDMEDKDMEDKDMEDKDMGDKDMEDKDMEDKDMEDKDMEDMDMEDKDMEDKDKEDKDTEESKITNLGGASSILTFIKNGKVYTLNFDTLTSGNISPSPISTISAVDPIKLVRYFIVGNGDLYKEPLNIGLLQGNLTRKYTTRINDEPL